MEKWLSASKVRQLLGVHPNTLRSWANEGKVITKRSAGNHRLYLYSSLPISENEPKVSVCYVRVSSAKQKDDLRRQEKFMRDLFPEHEIIKDIGSGINFKRKGLNALLDRICRQNIEEIVIAHKDRLCRFGFDLFERFCKLNGAKIVVLDKSELSPNEELVQDLCSIIHVFSCRIHGLRRYSKEIKKDQSLSQNKGPEEDS